MNETLEPKSVTPAALALRVLSAGFVYPDAAWRPRFSALLAQARQAGAFPQDVLRGLEQAWTALSPEALEAEHFRLFGSGAACTLDLSHHMTPNPFQQAKRLADVAGFYKAFGVEAGERADSLPVLLEFSAYLEIKRAHARASGRADAEGVTRDAAVKFSREILAPGLERFSTKLERVGANDFYLRLASAAKLFLGGLS